MKTHMYIQTSDKITPIHSNNKEIDRCSLDMDIPCLWTTLKFPASATTASVTTCQRMWLHNYIFHVFSFFNSVNNLHVPIHVLATFAVLLLFTDYEQ